MIFWQINILDWTIFVKLSNAENKRWENEGVKGFTPIFETKIKIREIINSDKMIKSFMDLQNLAF